MKHICWKFSLLFAFLRMHGSDFQFSYSVILQSSTLWHVQVSILWITFFTSHAASMYKLQNYGLLLQPGNFKYVGYSSNLFSYITIINDQESPFLTNEAWQQCNQMQTLGCCSIVEVLFLRAQVCFQLHGRCCDGKSQS